MKIKLDENLPFPRNPTERSGLRRSYGTRRVPYWTFRQGDLGSNTEGMEIPSYSRFGFSDWRQFAPGSHHGTLLVRLRSLNRRDLIERVAELFQKENVGEWAGCHRAQDSRAKAG
jgi:hypothetical protein